MGLWGSDKRVFEDIPDEQLNWNQQQFKKWRSRDPFYVDSGGHYSDEGKRIIDARLNASLGLNDIDDLFQMKAPRFYYTYTHASNNIDLLLEYVQKNIPNNNNYYELKGKYEELKTKNGELRAKVADQHSLINKLMKQVESLQNQNSKLQDQLIEKVNDQSSSFFR